MELELEDRIAQRITLFITSPLALALRSSCNGVTMKISCDEYTQLSRRSFLSDGAQTMAGLLLPLAARPSPLATRYSPLLFTHANEVQSLNSRGIIIW